MGAVWCVRVCLAANAAVKDKSAQWRRMKKQMLIKLRLAKCGQKIKERDTPTLKERERETKVKF